MSNSKVDDPRDASLEVPFSLPNTWPVETGGTQSLKESFTLLTSLISDGLAASGLFLSGLIMVTRNRSVNLCTFVQLANIWKGFWRGHLCFLVSTHKSTNIHYGQRRAREVSRTLGAFVPTFPGLFSQTLQPCSSRSCSILYPCPHHPIPNSGSLNTLKGCILPRVMH